MTWSSSPVRSPTLRRAAPPSTPRSSNRSWRRARSGRNRLSMRSRRASMRFWSDMASGKNNAAMASASLVIAEQSVEKYVHSIFQKLGLAWQSDVHRRVKAVLLFLSEQRRQALQRVPHLLQHAGSEALLVDVRRGAACAGVSPEDRLAIARHQHNPRRGLGRADPPGRLYPADARHPDVHQDEVRLERPASWTASSPDIASAMSSKPGVAATTARAARRNGAWSSTTTTPPSLSARAGSCRLMRAPWPGDDSIRRLPPIAPSRSVMFASPAPRALAAGSKPAPSSDTSKSEASLRLPHADRRRGRLARVLAGVLQCLETAEVHRRLDLGRVAADARRPRAACATGRAPRRRKEPRRGRDPPGTADRSRGRAPAGPPAPPPGRPRAGRAGRSPAAGSEPASSRARRRFTMSATSCCWAPSWRSRSIRRRSASRRRDDAGARGPELLGLPPDLVERRLQLRVEPDVAQCEARPAARARRGCALRARRMARRPARAPRRSAPGARPPFAIGATLSGRSPRPSRSAGSHTASQRRPGDSGCGHHGLLGGVEREACPAAIGSRRPPARTARRTPSRPRPTRAGAHGGATRRAPAAARPAGPRGSAVIPNAAQYLARSPRRSARQQAAGHALEPPAHRLVEERRDCRGDHRDGEHRALLVA